METKKSKLYKYAQTGGGMLTIKTNDEIISIPTANINIMKIHNLQPHEYTTLTFPSELIFTPKPGKPSEITYYISKINDIEYAIHILKSNKNPTKAPTYVKVFNTNFIFEYNEILPEEPPLIIKDVVVYNSLKCDSYEYEIQLKNKEKINITSITLPPNIYKALIKNINLNNSKYDLQRQNINTELFDFIILNITYNVKISKSQIELYISNNYDKYLIIDISSVQLKQIYSEYGCDIINRFYNKQNEIIKGVFDRL